jgi:hypothetical protein
MSPTLILFFFNIRDISLDILNDDKSLKNSKDKSSEEFSFGKELMIVWRYGQGKSMWLY